MSIPKMYLDAPMHSVTISGNEAFKEVTKVKLGFPDGSESKESACRAGDPSVICGMGRSPGKGNGYPLSILAWRIPWTEEPGGLQSFGSQIWA